MSEKSMKKHVSLWVNDRKVCVPDYFTILQAAQTQDVEIPIFCYHARLSIAGNCRMCLVQVEGERKPIASCAMPVAEGMKVRTDTQFVRESREGALEFLLLNHPLDCPICDQGGECDLQDISVSYGRDKSRYHFPKRAVQVKDFGPLIKTDMNRCIHCTRCVRFATEVAGVQGLGASGRGEHTEIVSLLGKPFASEMSGNVIDLCPVGALTSRPYAYKGRPWEMRRTETIDVMDAVGSHIRVDTRGVEVMRVLPRVFDPVNEEWISDRSRFSYDGLKKNRLDRPYVRDSHGILKEASWEEAFAAAAKKVKSVHGSEIAALAGDLVDVEGVYSLKLLMDFLKTPHRDCRQDDAFSLPQPPRCSYIMNTPIERVEECDFALLVGVNLRSDAPLVNTRLRKAYAHGNLQAALIGPNIDLTYPVTFCGDNPEILTEILSGRHAVCAGLKNAKKPAIFLGQDALARQDGQAFLSACLAIAQKYSLIQKDWCGFNVVQKAAGRVGAMDVGFLPGKNGKKTSEILLAAGQKEMKVVYLLAADEVNADSLKDTFVIYQGHHGGPVAEVADVIFPSAAYTEKEGLYVNIEGRPQVTFRACPAPGQALSDWEIVTRLSAHLGFSMSFHHVSDVRQDLGKKWPNLMSVGDRPKEIFQSFQSAFKTQKKFLKDPVQCVGEGFYATNIIARHSSVMDNCRRAFGSEPGRSL